MDDAARQADEAARRVREGVQQAHEAAPAPFTEARQRAQERARERAIAPQRAEGVQSRDDRLTHIEQLLGSVAEQQAVQAEMLRELLRRLPEHS